MIAIIITCAAFIAVAAGEVIILVGGIIGATEVCYVGLWMCVGGVLTFVVLAAIACCICSSHADDLEEQK